MNLRAKDMKIRTHTALYNVLMELVSKLRCHTQYYRKSLSFDTTQGFISDRTKFFYFKELLTLISCLTNPVIANILYNMPEIPR